MFKVVNISVKEPYIIDDKKLDLTPVYEKSIALVIVISIVFLGIMVSLLLRFRMHQNKILNEIRRLGVGKQKSTFDNVILSRGEEYFYEDFRE